MLKIFPPKEFYVLLAAVEDSCDLGRNRQLVEAFLANLKQTNTKISDVTAVERLPGEAFGGAYRKGDTFLTSASEALKNLTAIEIDLVGSHLEACATLLSHDPDLVKHFGMVLA